MDPENRFMEKLTKNNYSHYVFMMPLKDLKITSIIMNQGIEMNTALVNEEKFEIERTFFVNDGAVQKKTNGLDCSEKRNSNRFF